MSSVRVAIASTPLTATLDEAVPAVVDAVREASRLGAALVGLPETAIPGHRGQPRTVPDCAQAELDAATAEVAAAAAAAGVVTVLGTERLTPAGRTIVATVLGADGTVLGEQPKTQIDPSEEPHYVAGAGRRTFDAAGVRFGVAICHEATRYPETVRAPAVQGAQLVFAPHWVVTDDGSLPTRWGDPANPYNETALRLRAMENTIYVAAVNNAGPDQGSITGIVDPDGGLVAHVPYGEVGVVAADLDLARADRLLARRWAPARNAAG